MKRIMFVCHGNICRSPMAEFIFKKLINDRGCASEFYVMSSATSREEIWRGIGNPVHPLAKRELELHGISCSGKRAGLLLKSDYDNFDLFIGMDTNNIRSMHRIFGEDKDNKIHKLMEYTSYGGDVSDPWYHGRFDATYIDIYKGCVGLLEKLNSTK